MKANILKKSKGTTMDFVVNGHYADVTYISNRGNSVTFRIDVADLPRVMGTVTHVRATKDGNLVCTVDGATMSLSKYILGGRKKYNAGSKWDFTTQISSSDADLLFASIKRREELIAELRLLDETIKGLSKNVKGVA